MNMQKQAKGRGKISTNAKIVRCALALLLAIILIFSSVAPIFAASVDDMEEDLQELQEKLATLLRGCTACVVGWVSQRDVQEALHQEQDKVSLASTRDLPELIRLLQGKPGPVQVCPICGQLMRPYTNRTTGEKFLGCPGYRNHPAKPRS